MRIALAAFILISVCRIAAAADDQAAEALVARGLELRREGKPGEALELFQRAYTLAPSPRTLGQMGLVEASLAHWIDAEDHLTRALSTPQDSWVKKQRSFLDQALQLSRSHIGQILFTGPPGTTITVAGRAVGTLPNLPPVRLAEGSVLVTATAPGFKQFVLTVPVQANMQTPLNIDLSPIEVRPVAPSAAPLAALVSSPPAEVESHASWRKWAGGGLLGVGVASLGWGVAWVALDGHDSGGSCAPTARQPCKPVYNTATAGWILTGAGAAAAAGGGILLYTSRHHDEDVPIVSLGPGSLFLHGRF